MSMPSSDLGSAAWTTVAYFPVPGYKVRALCKMAYNFFFIIRPWQLHHILFAKYYSLLYFVLLTLFQEPLKKKPMVMILSLFLTLSSYRFDKLKCKALQHALFRCPCQICHNSTLRAIFEPPFAPNSELERSARLVTKMVVYYHSLTVASYFVC